MLTQPQLEVVNTLRTGRKRWIDLKRETRRSKRTLWLALKFLVEKEGLVLRTQEQSEKYPPPVYYELSSEGKDRLDSITNENEKTWSRIDKWARMRSLLETIERDEEDLSDKFLMFLSLCETFLQNEMQLINNQLTIAAIIHNQKRRDSQEIRSEALANFASYAQLIFEMCSLSPAFTMALAYATKDEGLSDVFKDYDYDLVDLVADEEQGYEDLMWEAFWPPTLLSDGHSDMPYNIPTVANVRRDARENKRIPKRFLRRYVMRIAKLMEIRRK
jgi:DNA-binding HxlR family transcriptional regulator